MKDYKKFIAAIVGLTAAYHLLNEQIQLPLVSIGTLTTFIVMLYATWDKYLWKIKRFPIPQLGGAIGFHNYPDLSGTWNVKIKSSYDNYGAEFAGTMRIIQEYSCIYLVAQFGDSKSESFIAQLYQRENREWSLTYGFRNTPVNPSLTNSQNGGMHEGFAYLDVESTSLLRGYYTNDNSRKTRGSITMTRN